MLGKTNIRPLAEGVIVTEIEDYAWIQVPCGLSGNFVRTAQGGGCLAGITADGGVAYTADGEVWKTVKLNYQDCRLEDIIWDGERFVLAGSYKADTTRHLILISKDLEEYEEFTIQQTTTNYKSIMAVLYQNGKYIMLSSEATKIVVNRETREEDDRRSIASSVATVKTVRGMGYIYVLYKTISGATSYGIARSNEDTNESIGTQNPDGNLFECKDEIYWMCLRSADKYNLKKISEPGANLIMSTEQNFAFVDGIYFSGCRVFINRHEMLVLKKGENLADKTIEDLVEIAPENRLSCITKAFGALYAFGEYGCILRSSAVTNNEQSIAVQAMSAKKALADAKAYTAEEIRKLEDRIEALEAKAGSAAGV